MLWYKAWLETRVRFLICLIGMTFLGTYPVRDDIHWGRPEMTLDYYYRSVHGGLGLIGALWLAAVIFLMMGGLLREKAAGSSSFTLALPFSRKRLMGVRIAIGLIEAVVLIVVPAAATCIQVSVIGKPYPISQVWFSFVLLISGGLVAFAVALLTASLVEGEYTAPLASFGILIAAVPALGDPRLQKVNPYAFMAGNDYFDRASGLLLGPIPWMQGGCYLLLAALLALAAVKVVEVRDF